MKKKPGVLLFYDEWRPILNNLNSEETNTFFRATIDYAEYGIIPVFEDRALEIAWNQILNSIDRNSKSYSEKIMRSKFGGFKKSWKDSHNGAECTIEFKDWWIDSQDYTSDLFTNEAWYEEAVVEHANRNDNSNSITNINDNETENINEVRTTKEAKARGREVKASSDPRGFYDVYNDKETLDKATALEVSMRGLRK